MLSYFLVQAQDLLPDGPCFAIPVRNPLAVVASMKKVATKQMAGWNIKQTHINSSTIIFMYMMPTRKGN